MLLQEGSTYFSRRVLNFTQIVLIGILSLSFSGCLESKGVVITPAQLMDGVVIAPGGGVVPTASVFLYSLKGNTTGLQIDVQVTDNFGGFSLNLPRHSTYASNMIVQVPSVFSFPFYGFATGNQVIVDLTSTVVYELLTSSPALIPAFEVEDLEELLKSARSVIANQILNHLIQPDATTPENLRKAYKNALTADAAFMNQYKTTALLKGYNVINLIPFGALNQSPAVLGTVPKIQTPAVQETKTLTMNISALDRDKDFIFYQWKAQPIKNNCNLPNEVVLGPALELGYGKETITLAPDYSFTDWRNPNLIYKVTASVSDGGLIATGVWCVTVGNVQRAPIFTSTMPLTGAEEQLWTYTPTSFSLDDAPISMDLVAGYPAGMDMCINIAPLGITPVWNWKALPAGRPCAIPNQIIWTPNNCQSNIANFFQIQAVDILNVSAFQGGIVQLTELNTAPAIVSAAPPTVLGLTTEGVAWTWQIQTQDPQADPNYSVGNIMGNNPSPYAFSPGGIGCADKIVYSLVQQPTSATINVDTGLISWTPQDSETGSVSFTVKADDSHGGSTTQTFSLNTARLAYPPIFSDLTLPDVWGGTIQVDEELYTSTSYFLNVFYSDFNTYEFEHLFSPDHSLVLSGTVPGTMTVAGPNYGGYNSAYFTLSWPITDAETVGSPTYPTTLTICDKNTKDDPFPAILPGAPTTFVLGPPHDHYCTAANITFSAPKRNIQPEFTSSPLSTVIGTTVVGDPDYIYNVAVTDLNTHPADTLSFSLVQKPTGMTITPGSTTAPTGTAQVVWRPNNTTDLGLHNIQIQVQDSNAYPGASHIADQFFGILVLEKSLPPVITSTPVTTAQNGLLYQYQIVATTPNTTTPNKTLTYSIVSGPSGMTVDSASGLVSWTPTVAQAKIGTANVTVSVRNGGSPQHVITQGPYTININYVNGPPVWDPTTDPIVGILVPMNFGISATDPDTDPLSISPVALPAGATLQDGGNGSAVLSWTPSTLGLFTATVAVNDGQGHIINQNINITVTDSPVFLSHPILTAYLGVQYSYEVHAFDPAGGNISYGIDLSPGGMQLVTTAGVTQLRYTASNGSQGVRQVTIRATASNGKFATQSFDLNVKATSNNAPTISGVSPSQASPANIPEGKSSSFSVTASDMNSDPLHYAWYWDNVWVNDAGTPYLYVPSSTSAGNHTMRVDVADGAAVVSSTFQVHVRNTVPSLGMSYIFPSQFTPLLQFQVLPRAQRIVATTGGSNPTYHIFPQATFSSGPSSRKQGLPFSPGRIVVRNDLPSASFIQTFIAQNGVIGDPSNLYFSIPSDTLNLLNCDPIGCGPILFNGIYPFSGGTGTILGSSSTRFNINPADTSKLSSSAAADFDLGAAGSGLAWDTTNSRAYISLPSQDQVLVYNPATTTVTKTLNLPAGSGPSAMIYNSTSKFLYVYNGGDGSLTEINTTSETITGTTAGFPLAPSLGVNPPAVMAMDELDNLLFITIQDQSLMLVYDPTSGTVESADFTGYAPSAIYFDSTARRAIGASYPGNMLFEVK